jgi:TetR/AcrR family transcriptional regulator, fatty acid metabolism regulator protein
MSKPDVASERKEQIVKATVECITRHGYHNFSMQDVARTAGVSKGIIHYYFLNKDELMVSVLDKVASDIESILAEKMQQSQDPWRKMEIFIDVCFAIVKNTKEYYQVNMDFWTQINQKSEIRTIIAQHYSKFREAAARVIREGCDKGAFKKVDPIAFASYMIAVIDGLSLQWLFDEKVFDYDAMSKKANGLIMAGLK